MSSSESSSRPVHSSRLPDAFHTPVSRGDPSKQLTHEAFASVDWAGSNALAFPSIDRQTEQCTYQRAVRNLITTTLFVLTDVDVLEERVATFAAGAEADGGRERSIVVLVVRF